MGASADILQTLGLAGDDAAGGGGGRRGKHHNEKHPKGGGFGGGDRSVRRVTAEEGADGAGLGKEDDAARRRAASLRYRIPSSSVFMTVVVGFLQKGPAALAKQLGTRGGGGKGAPGSGAAGPAPRVPLPEYSGWKRLAPLARSLLTALLHLLTTARDGSLLLFLLRATRDFLLYAAPFPKLQRKLIKALVELFSHPPQVSTISFALAAATGDASAAAAASGKSAGAAGGAGAAAAESVPADTEASIRIAAFLRLRQAAVSLPHPALDAVFKGAYLGYVRASRAMNEASAPGVLLMAQCLAELYGVDEGAAYSHAFIYLRQLALHLRAALTTQTKEAVQAVYSWQYVNALRCWTAVLSRHASSPARPLFQLIFPLVQLLLGTARLVPTPRFFPLRLHAATMLTSLSWSTGVYVPIAPLLVEVLRSPALAAKPKEAATSTPPALALLIKVSEKALATRAVQDAVVNRALDVLLDAIKSQYYSIALPELVIPPVHALRAFAKGTRVALWRQRARAVADAFVAQAARIAAKRAALSVAPSDRAAVAAFMAAEAAQLKAERQAAREASAAAALREAQAKAAAARAAADDAASSDDDDEDEEGGAPAKRARKGDARDAGASSSSAAASGGGKKKKAVRFGGEMGPTGKKAAAPPAPAGTGKKGKKPIPRGGRADAVEDIDLDDL